MAFYINDNCVICRMCDIHCPMDAIKYGNHGYQILPNRCVECGTCLRYCNVGAIVDPNALEDRPVTVPDGHMECDLAVIGGGGAGLVAAVKTAQQTGKRVVILEKGQNCGGSAWFAVGMRQGYTKWDAAKGLPDNSEADIRRVLRETKYLVDPKLVEATIYGSGAFFDWLCELGGTEEVFGYQDTPVGFGLDFLDKPVGARGGVGRWVVLKMREYCEKLGIQVLTGHRVTGLRRQQEGTWEITAEGPQGLCTVTASACMLSTGNFLYNQELIQKYAPLYGQAKLAQNGHYLPELTGDGLALGEQAGAKMGYETICLCAYGPTPVPMSPLLLALGESSEVVLIDQNGARWVDESQAGDGNLQLLRHPGAQTYAVFDQRVFDMIVKAWVDTGRTSATQEPVSSQHLAEINYFLDAADRPIIRTDTLEELAAAMEVDPQALSDTIERYNEYCKCGKDREFHKDPQYLYPVLQPPYYAVRRLMHPDGANGGVWINEKLEVQAETGGVVPGLYSGGDITSGQYISNGWGRKDRIVSDLTWAFTSGFLAGRSISEYLERQPERIHKEEE